HGRLLYTGDFKLRRGLSAEPCATPQTDDLIMETTFGRPHYVFPPTEKVLRDIAHFCQETLADEMTPVLFGYSLGKSQELLSGLSAAQLPVMLHPQTFKLTRVYEEFGIRFPPYREFSYDELAGHVVICPPQSRDSFFVRKIPQRRTAVVTGWATDPNAVYRYQCDAAFPLSDHADFPDLLRFVEAVQPKRVLTLHGFAREFAQTLRERGIEAWAVGQDNQLELGIESRAGLRPALRDEGGSETRPTPEHDAPEAFVHFVTTADAVKATPKKLEKIALLQAYLGALSPDDAATAATFFTGRSFPQTDPRNLNLGWAVIKRAVVEVSGVSEGDLYAAYRRYADTGDATASVLSQSRVEPPVGAPLRGVGSENDVSQTSDASERRPYPGRYLGHEPRTLSEIARFFASVTAARGPALKLELLRDMLATLSPDEARYLVKIITGDLRIGLKEGLLEEAIATASQEPLEAVREANMLSGDIAAVAKAARTHRLDTIQLTVFRPLQFMLASPEPTAEAIVARFAAMQAPTPTVGAALRRDDPSADQTEPKVAEDETNESRREAAPTLSIPDDAEVVASSSTADQASTIWVEEKYDGIRCQLHKAGGRVELYSRDLSRITEQFPDLARAALNLPGDFIADGELLAWREGRALPFAELQKRLGRKGGDDFFLGSEIPVSISFYDLLWLNGRTLLKEPLVTRRSLLAGLLEEFVGAALRRDSAELSRREAAPTTNVTEASHEGVAVSSSSSSSHPFVLAPVQQVSDAREIETAFLAARQRGNEGLMAKDPQSFYTPGRRGLAWLKLKKAYATLDVVVVAVEYGHGKRRDVLSDYTFAIRDTDSDRLLTLGKAYSGLTDVEIATLTQHFLDHTIEDHGRYRTVNPDTVIEVAFDTIQPSKRHQSGYALRFPRIARLRPDKTIAEIDTLETCRRLAEAASGFAAHSSTFE
ncbi:MAG TPA: ATP-dependent DNA ligase, partial [Opitutus sp.]|nr:ATP-dependent DNA ligase [Opitutus sp.]